MKKRLGMLCFGLCVMLAPQLWAQGNFVYTESNLGRPNNMNAVIGFRNDGAGNLTMLPGSPYLTRGTGVFDPNGALNPTDADQQVTIDAQGNFLYAVNGHSNTISVFSIASNGVLSLVRGTPLSSGGINPASIGIDTSLQVLVSVNRDGDPTQRVNRTVPNYTTAFVNSDGTFTPTGNPFQLEALSRPEQALMDQADNVMFGLQYVSANITSYSLDAGGKLTQVTQLGPPVAGAQPLGEALNPGQRVLYVSFPVSALIGIYSYDSSGNLTFVQTIPAVGGNCWMVVNAAGNRLYVANSGAASISTYDISTATSPVLLQTVTLRNALRAFNMAIDPTGGFLYVVELGHHLHTMQVLSDGTLHEASSSPLTMPLPNAAAPVGVATVVK